MESWLGGKPGQVRHVEISIESESEAVLGDIEPTAESIPDSREPVSQLDRLVEDVEWILRQYHGWWHQRWAADGDERWIRDPFYDLESQYDRLVETFGKTPEEILHDPVLWLDIDNDEHDRAEFEDHVRTLLVREPDIAQRRAGIFTVVYFPSFRPLREQRRRRRLGLSEFEAE